MIKPKTRKEKLLSAIANDTPVPIQPKNREELFLAQIAEKTGNVPKPLTQEWLPKGYPWDGRTVIEWDGNTEGMETDSSGAYVKVSDATPSYSDLLGGAISIPAMNATEEITDAYLSEGDGYIDVMFGIYIVVTKENAVYAEGIAFAKTGTYLMAGAGAMSLMYGGEVLKMSMEYMPVVKFYAAGSNDPYLYSDANTTIKVTKVDLVDAYGKFIQVRTTGGGFMYMPVFIHPGWGDTYGGVLIYDWGVDKYQELYTAEYTPS